MKTVIYSSPFVPAEWIAAHGVRPRRIRPDPAAASPSAGPLMGVCPYARAFMGEVLSAPAAGAAVFTTTCDQMRRAAEWAGRGGGPPVFLMNVPATWQTPAAARLYRDELRRLGRFLVRLGGAAPSPARLAETLEAYDARRAALRGALGTLSARQASEAIARFDLGSEKVSSEKVSGTLRLKVPDTFSDDTFSDPAPDLPRGTPVALVGGPLMRGDSLIFDTLEKAGGVVVLDGTENGARTLPAPVDRRRLRDDPLMELVDAYFGTIPDAFRRPDTALYAWLKRELAASAARGIIVWRYVWCDMWAASAARLRETTGLPVLDLDVSGDPARQGGAVASPGGLTRSAGRIQAFMEVLK
ncbi:MAG: 2-hydroxyacyl-CoA dehydratase family protein [Planctomycetota bacterium]|nr:2-hydroxyacyl-CoA dehydratase family protein [Planctomycetota bacterium]